MRSGNSSDSAVIGDTAVARKVDDTAASETDTGEELPKVETKSIELVGLTLAERYLVTRKVGQGGMGAVYEATHTLIGKRVAVKVLLEKYAQREAIVKRLKQEAQLASSIGNEHIIDITDFGTTEDGRTFVVMEFLEGESLAECLARDTSLGEQRILRVVSQAASALAAAHAKGIVHRDIKPENLFLLRRKDTDFVKVVDFGISKSLRASTEEEANTRLTQTGMVLGTPLYMSPEQARGDEELDHRVDVYALGVIMYECATGRVPFVGNNYLSVISQVLNEEPKGLREQKPEFSEEFEAVVQKAMAKDVNDRYASALDMLADVNALLEDPTHSTERAKITGPRRRLGKKPDGSIKLIVWVAGIAVVLAATIFSVTQLLGSKKPPPTPPTPGSAVLVAPSPPVDAAVPIDAPPEPKAEVLTVRFESTPPGAVIFLDGFEQAGVTPLEADVVKKDKDIKLAGQLPGWKQYDLEFNPLTLRPAKDGTLVVKFRLEKAPKGTTPTFVRPKPEQGSAAPQHKDKTGGELSGDPYSQGGNVPKQ